jgi:hypothetical protein
VIAHPPEATSYDLLAKELGAESPDTQDVGDGVGVPPFGQHGDADHTPDGLPQFAGLADRVHNLPEDLVVRNFLRVPARIAATNLLFEFLNFHGGHLLVIGAQTLAGL